VFCHPLAHCIYTLHSSSAPPTTKHLPPQYTAQAPTLHCTQSHTHTRITQAAGPALLAVEALGSSVGAEAAAAYALGFVAGSTSSTSSTSDVVAFAKTLPHSCEPTCVFQNSTGSLVARADVLAGGSLTVDYGTLEALHDQPSACKCKSHVRCSSLSLAARTP
jgi:hypothetical protein